MNGTNLSGKDFRIKLAQSFAVCLEKPYPCHVLKVPEFSNPDIIQVDSEKYVKVESIHNLTTIGIRGDCKYCAAKHSNRKSIQTYCRECHIYLCEDCFGEYHQLFVYT
eukprot:TRINITY_DN23124_c0_g2_i1.p2 TRINITY_DN23124_c0_g2~~TRINITY_DN23124_c0_g2_i1.p2  ORF type:complete len:108 (+),score=5.72 TRINITY_DN23124_c0_g2_i1:235-558(+)